MKTFLKTYAVIVAILVFIIFILFIAGNFNRKAYLSEFKFDDTHITKTLELNNLNADEIKKIFINTNDNIIDNNALTNYIFTNEAITNYYYGFRVKYYSKIFRNSDIYGVYPNITKILEDNSYIREIKMDDDGSPFGNLISEKKINDEKIDNVYYKLKLKIKFVLYFIVVLILIFIIFVAFLYQKKIYKFISNNDKKITRIYFIISLILVICIKFISILGSLNREASLTDIILNPPETIRLNKIDNDKIKSLKTEEDIRNYLLTNETIDITNYVYNFRISFYSKTFKNSDIYNVYLELDSLPEYIEGVVMWGDGVPFGQFNTKEKININHIDNIKYKLEIKNRIDSISNILLISIIIILIVYFLNKLENKSSEYYQNRNNILNRNDYLFIGFISLLSIICLVFQFWLFFPGNFQHSDTLFIMLNTIQGNYGNAHPLIIQLFLKVLYSLFGYHSWYIYLLQMMLFYIGLYIIILTIYLLLRNKIISTIFLIIIMFIPNLFFQNFYDVKDITASLYMWFSCSIFFMLSVVKLNKKLYIIFEVISIFSLIVGMLWRHSFIVTVYPIFILFVFNILESKKTKNIKQYLFYFVSIMLSFAVILILIYSSFPRLFLNYRGNNINGLKLFQIAACAANSNDDSMILDEWYMEGKTFKDLKNTYMKYPTYADIFVAPWIPDRIFKFGNVIKDKDVNKVWLKYIFKHPSSYIKHMLNYAEVICFMNPNLKGTVDTIQSIPNIGYNDEKFYSYFDYKKITFTPIKEKIYIYLWHCIPNMNMIYYVIISIILFIVSGLLWIIKSNFRNRLLLFTFCTSFSAFATEVIMISLTPVLEYRYIHPIVPVTVISLVSFIVFIFDVIKNYKRN